MAERKQQKRVAGKPYMVRQGDVLLLEVESLPSGAKLVKRGNDKRGIILALGESSGHGHGIASRQAREFMHGEDRYVVIGGKGATLSHEMPDRAPTGDHAPVKLPAATFRLVQQREYSDEMVMLVAD